MANEEAHLDPTIGWDKDVLSYFNYHMTQCKYDDQVLHSASIKVMVKVWIKYELIKELDFNEEEIDQLLIPLGHCFWIFCINFSCYILDNEIVPSKDWK